ncbi:MAG TPA: hypothetical protein VHS32_03730, partial [Streptosporangiaceae bacterium]|nr:hypothetical protein [Streptosporangiaceae bacterium]
SRGVSPATEAEAQQQATSSRLLLTKLHPPQRREQTIERARLLQRLHAEPGTKLTIVAAPAGSG